MVMSAWCCLHPRLQPLTLQELCGLFQTPQAPVVMLQMLIPAGSTIKVQGVLTSGH